MTAWYIASIPFWIFGALFLLSFVAWARDSIRGKESVSDGAKYCMGSLIACGVLWIIAAKLVS